MPAAMQDIPQEITDTLGLVRELRTRLENELIAKPGYSAKMQKPLHELATTLKALSGEARMWAAQVQATMAAATPEQKTEVALAWLAELPVGARTAAYTALAEMEAASFERLPLRYGT